MNYAPAKTITATISAKRVASVTKAGNSVFELTLDATHLDGVEFAEPTTLTVLTRANSSVAYYIPIDPVAHVFHLTKAGTVHDITTA